MKRKGLVKVRVRGRKRDGSGIEKGDKGRVRGRVKGRGEGEGRKGGKLGTWRVEVEVEVEVEVLDMTLFDVQTLRDEDIVMKRRTL